VSTEEKLHAGRLTAQWAERERIVERFEAAWRSGQRPTIEEHLLGESRQRQALLVDLVHTDLECRLKAGEMQRVEAYLERYPELAGDTKLVVELVGAEYCLRRRNDATLSTVEYFERFPQYRHELEQYFSHAGESTLVDGKEPAWTAPAQGSGVRYRELRLHAEGGLGKVFLAHDETLCREVALKKLRPERANDPESRWRFLIEAEVTGRLQHPGVVPVYALADDGTGNPCYAMPFIAGESLKEAIERLHAMDDGAGNSLRRSLQFRQLLTRFIGVCNTVAYAHSRGILHRDIKPANIMLGKYGETLVVDWGLAKSVERSEEARAFGEETLVPVSGNEHATQTGELLGTPAFMSPEQAAGQWARVGPATDVYALGATLYNLITGRTPFSDAAPSLLLPKVQLGDFAKPREVTKDLSHALEAVCLKAMARRPDDRYQTPKLLAEDLERWLADEPVSAWAEPWIARAGRWVRRHRTVVAGTAALLVLAAIFLGVLATFLEHARRQSLAEQTRTEAARLRTRQALDEMSSQVIDKWLVQQKQLDAHHKAFLEKALSWYEEFAADTGNSEETRAGVGRAHIRVANIRSRLGQHAEAEAALRRAQEYWAVLVDEHPDVPKYRHELANVNNGLGLILSDLGKREEAITEYRAALKEIQRLRDEHPDVPEYANGLSKSHCNLGDLLSEIGKESEAQIEFHAALEEDNRLTEKYPVVPEYHRSRALTHNSLGILMAKSGKYRDSDAAFRIALREQQRLVEEYPTEPEYRRDLAMSHNNLGLTLYHSGKRADAEPEYRAALKEKQRLVDEHPAVPAYRNELAKSHNNLGNLMSDLGKRADAEIEYRAALKEQQRLADDHRLPAYRTELARTHNNLGVFLVDLGRPAQAETEYRAAVNLQRNLATESPDVPNHRYELAVTVVNMAKLRQAAGDCEQASALLREARPQIEEALRAYPKNSEYRSAYRDSLFTLGRILVSLGDHEAAAQVAEKLRTQGFEPANDNYNAACILCRLVPIVIKDSRLPESKRNEQARTYADKSLQNLGEAIRRGFNDGSQIKKEPDLDPIRSRDDFKKLLTKLEKGK
jgi:serine/threonine-protein kinase